MARAAKKKKPALQMIEFSRARDIPFNRIHLSADNVREIDVDAGLDDLTHDIERREDLVQGLNVRAILDAAAAVRGGPPRTGPEVRPEAAAGPPATGTPTAWIAAGGAAVLVAVILVVIGLLVLYKGIHALVG